MAGARVPVEELVDLERIRGADGVVHQARLRSALPRGWVLEQDLRHARRDLRLLFREGWILLVGLVAFGAAVLGLFAATFPRGAAGWIRAGILLALLVAAGGIVAPIVTRAVRSQARLRNPGDP